MSQRTKSQNASRQHHDFQDLVPSLTLNDWEDKEHFRAIEDAFIAELAPATALELSIVKRLAANEWDYHRSDTLKAKLLRTCLRKAALEPSSDDFPPLPPTSGDQKTADDLVSEDPKRRKRATAALAKAGVSISDLVAQAYLAAFREFEALERRPDVFDRRRRELKEDLRRLQEQRRRRKVEDAEVVDAHGD